VENCIFSYSLNDFFCTGFLLNKEGFTQGLLKKILSLFFHNSFFHYPQPTVDNL